MQNDADEMKTQAPTPRHITRECGFTLIELLIGITVTLAVILAAFPIIDGAANTEGRVQQAALSVGDARAFSEKVLRDLRSADSFTPTSSSRVTMHTYVRDNPCGSGVVSAEDAPPTSCTVIYDCPEITPATTPPTYSCTRQEGAGAPITLISGLDSSDVFSYVLDGDRYRYVSITIVMPNQQNIGGDAITLEDGTTLRNVP